MKFKEPERSRLLELLKGSDHAIRKIESEIDRYALTKISLRELHQRPSEIKKEADDLHQALQTVARIISNGGEAWDNFQAAAADDGLAAILHSLKEALGTGAGEPGEALVRIAAGVSDDLKPSAHRPRSPESTSRFILIFHLANAAREAGVLVSRNSTAFQEIAAAVYGAAGIQQDPDHDIRAYMGTITKHK